MNISAKDVMALRKETGLGMMDCKEALKECGGDFKAAVELLREKMKGKMDTRTDRAAGEGCIVIAIDGSQAVILEARAETDFTARNEGFVAMAEELARTAMTKPAGEVAMDDAMTARMDDVRIKTGENISIPRIMKLEGGSFGKYLHHDGKLGVLIHIDGSADEDVLTGVCQHVAAHVPTPVAVDEADMPADLVAEHKAEAVKQAEESGKPAEIAEMIAQGKMRKFFEDHTLLGQKYVRDDKKSVREILPSGVTVKGFHRFAVGG